MLFFNPNIRRKITYKLPVFLDEVQVEKKELYSYSVYTDDFKVKEVIFDERKINIFQYNPETMFVETQRVYDDHAEMTKKYYFDVSTFEESPLAERRDSLVHIFKHSPVDLNHNVCFGWIDLINESDNEYFKLHFHRVNSFLGYKVLVKFFKNKEGDFYKEEYYDESSKRIKYVLENDFEYKETELEKYVQNILNNGWD